MAFSTRLIFSGAVSILLKNNNPGVPLVISSKGDIMTDIANDDVTRMDFYCDLLLTVIISTLWVFCAALPLATDPYAHRTVTPLLARNVCRNRVFSQIGFYAQYIGNPHFSIRHR